MEGNRNKFGIVQIGRLLLVWQFEKVARAGYRIEINQKPLREDAVMETDSKKICSEVRWPQNLNGGQKV
jgi:hypothetical protein